MNPNSTDPKNTNNSNPSNSQPDLTSDALNQDWSTLPQTQSPTITTPSPLTTSPLDNPFNVPAQPPIIDGGFTQSPPIPEPISETSSNVNLNTPTIPTEPSPGTLSWQPPIIPSETAPNPQDIYLTNKQEMATAPIPMPESAPTDLSHLIPNSPDISGNQPEQSIYAPPITQPETLIVPPDSSEVDPNIPTENEHSKIPKWVIAVGIGILLAVAGTTTYFIWPGFGSSISNNSLNQTPQVEQSTQAPIAIPTSTIPTATPIIPTTTSGFGAVDGNSTPSATPPTSAADILRQRQQQGK